MIFWLMTLKRSISAFTTASMSEASTLGIAHVCCAITEPSSPLRRLGTGAEGGAVAGADADAGAGAGSVFDVAALPASACFAAIALFFMSTHWRRKARLYSPIIISSMADLSFKSGESGSVLMEGFILSASSTCLLGVVLSWKRVLS